MTARRGWAVIVVSVIALTLVLRFLPAGSPLIYDGQCVADPYMTLGSSPGPKPASMTFPKAVTFPPEGVATPEIPPQAQILIQGGAFDNSTAVTVTVTPVHATSMKPPNGTVVGNVYRISAVNAAGAELQPAPSLPVYIILRALSLTPAPTIDRFNGTSWIALPTYNSGCGNTYEGTSTKLGAFAAVVPGNGGGTPNASGGGIPVAAIIGGLALLMILVVALLFSLDRRRSAAR